MTLIVAGSLVSADFVGFGDLRRPESFCVIEQNADLAAFDFECAVDGARVIGHFSIAFGESNLCKTFPDFPLPSRVNIGCLAEINDHSHSGVRNVSGD